jgi:hypothetical protein
MMLNTAKKVRLEEANESLAMAQKMLSKFQDGVIPALEMSRIQDAAIQANQAAQQLNQLVGILLAEISR